ncbi:hypothetical protein D4S03_07360 [bacterium]|jgi:UDP-N-acetyl-D-mannosaminuronic acid transferase (WecB/TagA/CpsF family)|nr:MAG: hypothetical protein D4S03_07360 [bacterium]
MGRWSGHIADDVNASKMVSVAHKVTNDGTGIVTAMNKTNLANGVYYADLAHTFITPTEIT